MASSVVRPPVVSEARSQIRLANTVEYWKAFILRHEIPCLGWRCSVHLSCVRLGPISIQYLNPVNNSTYALACIECLVFTALRHLHVSVTSLLAVQSFALTDIDRDGCFGHTDRRKYVVPNCSCGFFINHPSVVSLIYRTWAVWGRDSKIVIGLVSLEATLGILAIVFVHSGHTKAEGTSTRLTHPLVWIWCTWNSCRQSSPERQRVLLHNFPWTCCFCKLLSDHGFRVRSVRLVLSHLPQWNSPCPILQSYLFWLCTR